MHRNSTLATININGGEEMKEYYVSYEQAKRLHELGFDGVEKYYVTENFCLGSDPYFFNTYSVGDLVNDVVVYFVNENNEDDFRGIPAPRLEQAQAWLREKGIFLMIDPRYYQGDALKDVKWCFIIQPLDDIGGQYRSERCGKLFDTYESALSKGIDKALELLTVKSTDKMNNQIATTPEQSQRLIACGVNPDSADMCYLYFNSDRGQISRNEYLRLYCETLTDCREELVPKNFVDCNYRDNDSPAWSLSALLELLPTPIYTEHHKQYALRIIRPHDHKAWIFDYESFDTSLYHTNGKTAIEACVRMIERLTANGYSLNKS